MTTVVINDAPRSCKYGVLYRGAGAKRQAVAFLTEQELAELNASGNGHPKALSREEWESGEYQVFGYDHDVGDVGQKPDGKMAVLLARRIEDGKFLVDTLDFEKTDFSGDVKRMTLAVPPDSKVLSVVDGVVVLKD